METNSSGRKKHVVEGTVEAVKKGVEVERPAASSEATRGVGRAQATPASQAKIGFFARLLRLLGLKK